MKNIVLIIIAMPNPVISRIEATIIIAFKIIMQRVDTTIICITIITKQVLLISIINDDSTKMFLSSSNFQIDYYSNNWRNGNSQSNEKFFRSKTNQNSSESSTDRINKRQ